MKRTLSKIALLLILITVSSVAQAQDNPWKQKSNDNPWGKTDSVHTTVVKTPVVEEKPQLVKQESQKADSVITEAQPVLESISTNSNEILFRYSYTRVVIDADSRRLDREMTNHIRENYKSRKMFWSNFGVTMGSITASLVSGSPIGLLGILGGAVASGFSSNQTKVALAAFRADNPNADQRIINKYKRKLQSKKAAAGIGGIGAGPGATIAAGAVILIVALATI